MNFSYKCKECEHIFDVQAKNYEEAQENKSCPECNSTETARYFASNSVAGLSRQGDTRNLKSPDWFKERVNHINKEMGTSASTYK